MRFYFHITTTITTPQSQTQQTPSSSSSPSASPSSLSLTGEAVLAALKERLTEVLDKGKGVTTTAAATRVHVFVLCLFSLLVCMRDW